MVYSETYSLVTTYRMIQWVVTSANYIIDVSRDTMFTRRAAILGLTTGTGRCLNITPSRHTGFINIEQSLLT